MIYGTYQIKGGGERHGASFFSRAFLSFVFFLFLAAANQANASCPSDLPSDYTESWTDGGCYVATLTVGGHTCSALVCFCYRIHYISGSIAAVDYYIKNIKYKAGCFGFGGPNWHDLLKAAGEKILTDNPTHVEYPPCNSSPAYYEARFFTGRCFNTESITENPWDTNLFDCQSGIGYCYEHWRLCTDPITGAITKTFVDSGPWNYNGGTCQSPCVDVCGGY